MAATLRFLLFCLTLILVSVSSTRADSITYQLTGNATGILGKKSFSDASFSITATGGSTGISTNTIPAWQRISVNVDIDISGIGMLQPVDPFYLFVDQFFSTVGFTQSTSGVSWENVLDFSGPALSNLYLMPPSHFPSVPVDVTLLAPFRTTSGLLSLSNAGNLSFAGAVPSAVPSTVPSTVPEPSSIVLMGPGLLAAAFWLLRKPR